MALQSRLAEHMPRMGWLYEESRSGRAELLHGADVEVFDDGFLEGCHVGDRPDAGFDRMGTVFGSGMRIRNGRPCFVPPSHTLEALYVFIHGDGYAVSNSLLLLIDHFDLTLPYDPHHGRKFCSIVHGIDAYESCLATLPQGTLARVFYDNFFIDSAGRIVRERKPSDLVFHDFQTYRDALTSVLTAAFKNAAWATRKQRYRALATASSGYDSACGAALANAAGCDELLTLECGTEADDSGIPIASALGMKAIVKQRIGHAADCHDLMVFYASGMGAEDFSHQIFEPYLPGRILITGFHGDKVWDIAAAPNDVIHRGDTSGCTFQEFRLRSGFVHVPVPMIGVRQHSLIVKISRSAERRPFSVGGDYDRPIPRRILEERGVARDAFGQKKRAVIMTFHWKPHTMSAAIRQEAALTARQSCGMMQRLLTQPIRMFAWKARALLFGLLVRCRVAPRLQSWAVGDWWDFYVDHPLQGLLFLTAVRLLRRPAGTDDGTTPFVQRKTP